VAGLQAGESRLGPIPAVGRYTAAVAEADDQVAPRQLSGAGDLVALVYATARPA
jgi:hypothetical protein